MEATSTICPWSFLGDGVSVHRSFASLVTPTVFPTTDLPTPVVQDGKTTVIISEDGYQSGLEKCKFMLLGRLQLASGDKPYSPSDLQRKLSLLWGELGDWKLIPMGKGYYTFSFTSDASRAWV
ncbi:hypothetical protein M0R45_020504 [Rubus argutus]|uniref:DUF4283 domain-containing protein n=1 Tax=Rubus argutus TaxID=59490 RepID=A0AAW1XA97_RUBAR